MPLLRRGALITLEGGEGSGKSTQAEALHHLLKDQGYPVTLTREPDGTEIGRLVKAIFQGAEGSLDPADVTPLTELFLFETARAQHVALVIRPALERGELVLCDRFTDSSLAYQGYGRGLPLEDVSTANDLATGGLQPDLTLLLDLAPESGLSRKGREAVRDNLGRQPLDFHRRVREGFLEIARREPQRVVVLDASRPSEKLTRAAWEHLRGFLDRLS